MRFYKFVPMMLSILLMLFPVFLNVTNPSSNGLRTIDVLAFISFCIGALTLSLFSVMYILNYFFHEKVKFWTILAILVSVTIFEYMLLLISSPIVSLFISPLNLLSESGNDDQIFFRIVLIFNCLFAGVIYYLTSRYLFFKHSTNPAKPALILGALRIFIPPVTFLLLNSN